MSPSSQAAPPNPPAVRWLSCIGRWLLIGTLWLVSVCALAWLTLHWGILPRLDQWRPQLQAALAERLGARVELGSLQTESGAWIPRLVVRDLVLRDPLGREALRLPQVSATVSVGSVLSGRWRLAQVLIDGARLDLRRDAQGRFWVAGLDLSGGSGEAADSGMPDWLWQIGEFVIRGAQVRWIDEQRGVPPLALTDVQLVLRNSGRRHDLRLDATPPADWGQRFQVVVQARQPLRLAARMADANDWRTWEGSLFAELPQADVAQLRRYVHLPVELRQGRAALRGWLDWAQARPRELLLDADLAAVQLRLAEGLPEIAFDRLKGRLFARRLDDGAELALTGLKFDTPEGIHWSDSDLKLRWRWASGPEPAAAPARAASANAQPQPGASGTALPPEWRIAGGTVSASRLDLGPLASLAERLPIGASLRRLLASLDPEGTVRGLQASWDGPLDAPARYQAKARLEGTAIASAPSPEPEGFGRPGWRGADLDLEASESGGNARLSVQRGALVFPGVFAEAEVPVRQFDAQLAWRIEPGRRAAGGRPQAPPLPRITLQVDSASFANDDVRGRLEARWQTGPGEGFGPGRRLPGVLSLKGRLGEADAARVARYLPLGLPASTRTWARYAVQAGQLREVDFKVAGDLWSFPFVQRDSGEFRISGQLAGGTLAVVPSTPATPQEPAWTSPWPAFTDVQGRLVFERDSMHFEQASGRLWGTRLGPVQGRIRQLSELAVLEVEGQAQGPAADFLRYVRTTPIQDWTHQVLAQASASGEAALDLALNLPLDRPEDTVARGTLELQGNDVRLRPDLPLLAAARGPVAFTHRGLELRQVHTRMLGGEAVIEGGTQGEAPMRFVANGTASDEGLRQTREFPELPWIGRHLRGQAPYRLELVFGEHGPEIALTSSLQGMAISLPAPMDKPAAAAWPLKLATSLRPVPGQGLTETLKVEAGALRGTVVRTAGAEPVRLLRHAWSWGAPLPEPVAGGQAHLVLPELDLGPWQALAHSPVAAGSPPAASTAGAPAPEADLMPRQIQLKAGEFTAMGRRLDQLTLDLRRIGGDDPVWRAQVTADQTQGRIEYREPRPGQPNGRVLARLARLELLPAEAEKVVDHLAQAPAHNLPALDIEVEQFILRGRNFGRLEVEALNRPAAGAGGGPTEWHLNRLQMQMPASSGSLQAAGVWSPARGAAARRLSLDFHLDVKDAGRLLEQLGFGQAIRGGTGELRGQLGWSGSPLEMDLPTLGGQFTLQMHKGQFMKADAGAARLLGVLSLQALPRRLVLDFRDLFQEGFAFDDASADVRIEAGIARTRNLRLRGMHAAVLIDGQADIARETQNLQVLVLPELNTVSASLAYAIVNPAAGLGALLGQWILREPLRQASAREFRITGSWDDPQVQRVERRIGDPLPPDSALEPASGAAVPVAPGGAPGAAPGGAPVPASPAASAPPRPGPAAPAVAMPPAAAASR